MSRRWMKTEEAAEHLKVTPAALISWRGKGVGPRYSRLGGEGGKRLVIYDVNDLDAFADGRAVEPRMKSSEMEAA